MSIIDWESIADVINISAIAAIGGPAILYRQTLSGTFNPDTGLMEGKAEASRTVNMVMTGRKTFWESGTVVKVWKLSAIIGIGSVSSAQQIIDGGLSLVGLVDVTDGGGATSSITSVAEGGGTISLDIFEPDMGDILYIGGRKWTIGDVNPVSPDGVHNIVYEVELRD